jgi:hypothetical protein
MGRLSETDKFKTMFALMNQFDMTQINWSKAAADMGLTPDGARKRVKAIMEEHGEGDSIGASATTTKKATKSAATAPKKAAAAPSDGAKRGRGRPPKRKAEEESDDQAAESEESAAVRGGMLGKGKAGRKTSAKRVKSQATVVVHESGGEGADAEEHQLSDGQDGGDDVEQDDE